MSSGWKFFRVLCVLQFLLATLLMFVYLYSFFDALWIKGIVGTMTFAFIAAFAALGLELLHKNYPNKSVAGSQKKKFNRLFIINFFLIAALFGFIFYEARIIRSGAALEKISAWRLPATHYYMSIIYGFVLINQFVLLSGIYNLRKELLNNEHEKQFSFENEFD